jgi:hypothetical protein
MSIALFISEDKLKRSTTINGNVDVEILRPYMKVAQDLHIWTKLGSKLYKKLQDDIANNTLQNPYEDLINDYIQDALVHWTLYEAIPFLGYKIMNKDIVRQTSETSTTPPLEELNYLRNTVMNTAEWYTERLIEHLCENNNLYPEYNTNSGDDVRPSKNNYNNGMNLGMGRYKDTNITLQDFLDSSI